MTPAVTSAVMTRTLRIAGLSVPLRAGLRRRDGLVPAYGGEGAQQHRVVDLAAGRDLQMADRRLEHTGGLERGGQLALLARRDQLVARGEDDRGGNRQTPQPRPR